MKKLLLLLVVLLSAVGAGIAQSTASGTFTKYTPNSTVSYTFGDVTWNIAVTWVKTVPVAQNVNGTLGAQIGTAKGAPKTITLSTNFFADKTINSITLNASQSGDANITGIFKVADQQVGDKFTCVKGTAKDFTVSNINKSGAIEIVLTNSKTTTSNNGAAYLKSVSVTYTDNGGGTSSDKKPQEITFNPASGPIDTNTEISLSADTDCKIYYTIDDTASEASILYTGPFTLSQGEHFVSAYAVNDAGYTEKKAYYTVTQAVEPTTAKATITFSKHSDWVYSSAKTTDTWTSDDGEYSFPIEVGIKDGEGATGTTYPKYVSSDFRIYYSSRSYLKLTAPSDYYFVSLEWACDQGSIKIDGTTVNAKSYTFSGKPTEFKINAVRENTAFTTMTIVLAKIETKVATPTFSIPTDSEVEVGQSVTISSATEGATALISVNDDILEETLPYTYTFNTKGEYKFTVVASKKDYIDSDEATADYTVVNPKVATPTFSVASGSTVEEGESVTINCATEGAKISGTVNDTAITDEELPYTYTFEKAGSYTIKVVASKADFDNSTEATATYTVTKFVAPAKPVFSVSSAQPTPSGTEVTISAEGATSLTVNTYGIDGYVAKTDVIEGNTATVTVDKMHRRFTAIANREANGKAAASEEVEAFYTIGNRTAATDNYTLVTSASELYDGMEFVMGVEGTNNVVMTTSKNTFDRIWYGGAATFANNEVTSLPTNALILVLEKAADGNWNIRTKDAISYYDNADETNAMRDTPRIGYFYSYALKTTSNYMQMSASPKASATIKYNDADGVGNATISFSKVAENQPYMIIRYNTNTNGGFAMYMETESANSYPLPRIYAKKTAVAEDNGYKMSFHHTPYKANGSVQAKVVAATSHSNETVLNGTVNKDGTSYTFTTKEVKNLCGKFYVKIETEELGGHISEAVKDFSDCNNESCTAEDHSPFVLVGNKEEKKLVLAKREDSVPLSTNPHGRLWLHTNPEVTVTLDPFRSIKMSLTSDKVTGVDDITVDSADAEVEYYNLQGIRVANPEHGIYIRRQGNTATKVRL